MEQQEALQRVIEHLDNLNAKPSEDEKREHLRDYFAAAALGGLTTKEPEHSWAADQAYKYADAMLKAKTTK